MPADDQLAAVHDLTGSPVVDSQHPSYYGAAVTALARVLLDTGLLTDCAIR